MNQLKNETHLSLNSGNKNFLKDTKNRLHASQMRATLSTNRELIQFYFELGSEIMKYQKLFPKSEKFLEQLSHDLRRNFPGMQGFSIRNLQRMRQFAQLYPDFLIAPQPVAQLPWGHISRLIQMVKDDAARKWYMQKTIEYGWSRIILEMQIQRDLYAQYGMNENKNHLKPQPENQSNLSNNLLKDPYNFDFLTIHAEAHERSIEDELIAHISKFLLDLQQGFALVGSKVPLTFDDQEYCIDLLFYHLELRAYIVIQLKASQFKPTHNGQFTFYLSVADELFKKEYDNPTIGILLCKSKNKIVAEYAIKKMTAPIGVPEYELLNALPKELKSKLPSVEEIEAELNEIN